MRLALELTRLADAARTLTVRVASLTGGVPAARLPARWGANGSPHTRTRVRCGLRWILAVVLSATACGGDRNPQTVTIYTSIYEHVIAALDPVLREAFPDLTVRWFQRGSEEIAARLNSEIAAGRVGADLVMTSDPFWYEELKAGGHLLEYRSPLAARIPAALTDPDGAFVTVRVPLIVLAVNTTRVAGAARPRTFRDLAEPAWAGRVTMGDPNRSGSAFTAMAALARRYGWQYFERLRANGIVAAGGNSAVLSRVVTGEKDAGIILLENVLQVREQNPDAPIDVVYPDDGAILVPSPIAILKTTMAPDAARRLYDFFLSDAGQAALVTGWMYSPVADVKPPAGARPWSEVSAAPLVPWTFDYLRETTRAREEIKRRFDRINSQPPT
jgi:iron(III) transport system substrate-binding protein